VRHKPNLRVSVLVCECASSLWNVRRRSAKGTLFPFKVGHHKPQDAKDGRAGGISVSEIAAFTRDH